MIIAFMRTREGARLTAGRWGRNMLLGWVIAALFVLALAAGARADTYATGCVAYPNQPLTPCRMDDRNADYCTLYPWQAAQGARFGEAMENLDAQTVLYDTYVSTCAYNTDLGGHISGQSGEYVLDLNTLGMYLCTKRTPDGTRCDQASVIFAPYNPNYSSNTSTKQTQWRNTLCHEVGHGVGLYHNAGEGCMGSVLATGYLYYTSHQVDHINSAH
ncbi:MAG: hypothetical protein JST33_04335 [Actinobacteria bacterium]|nr:hypothetical protein [Actinomycetota bacterium]